ncbi:MAG: hypothetical protein KME05_02150, partial [Gloeocapsa sp. UFS-A4-WI-NPMV-4B04]|nr:hypothetical protein [Gloeocapsa sp. UFS-A4-WI-NPMV-4B04]
LVERVPAIDDHHLVVLAVAVLLALAEIGAVRDGVRVCHLSKLGCLSPRWAAKNSQNSCLDSPRRCSDNCY